MSLAKAVSLIDAYQQQQEGKVCNCYQNGRDPQSEHARIQQHLHSSGELQRDQLGVYVPWSSQSAKRFELMHF